MKVGTEARTIDLLEGPILPALSRLALPIMATAFVQMAYNLTDMAWIGFLGSNSVAAVGAAGMFTWFAQGVMNIAKMEARSWWPSPSVPERNRRPGPT